MDKPNLTLEEALASGVVADRIEKHKGEFDFGPIGDEIKNQGDKTIHKEDIPPHEIALNGLGQRGQILDQRYQEMLDTGKIPLADAVRAVDQNVHSKKGAELLPNSLEEVSEAIKRATKIVKKKCL